MPNLAQVCLFGASTRAVALGRMLGRGLGCWWLFEAAQLLHPSSRLGTWH